MANTEGYVPRRIARSPSWLLATATRRGHRLVEENFSAEGLRRQHYLVLAGLAELDAPAQAELSRLLRVDSSDLVAILNDLEEAGYLRRERSSADRRRNAVLPTEQGLAALRRLDRLVEQANDVLLASLSPLERELFVSLLIRVILSDEQAGAAPGAAEPPAGGQASSGTRRR
jgi:DNA-binding MarR family transcriptional regulator